jgi:hypothetical protein
MTQITDKAQLLLDRIESLDIKKKIVNIFKVKPAAYGSLSYEVLERIQLSVLRLVTDKDFCFEDIEKIRILYITDTRDLIMSAGFGDDLTSHEKWFQRQK